MTFEAGRRITRRDSLRLLSGAAALVGGGIAGAGCSRSDASAPVTSLRFWNGFTGPDGRTMLRMVERFNAANPDISVMMQRMDWATYYNKLFVAGIGHRAPEVFVLHTHALDRFVHAGFARPNDDLIAGADSLDAAAIDSNVWRATEFDGRHYGLPLDVHTMGMYYNRRLFKEAGIVDEHGEPRPPTDRASFLDALRRLTKTGAGGAPEQWGFVFTNLETNVYTIMCQFGGRFFSDNGGKCLLNGVENVAALQFCVDLIRKYRYAPPPENFDAWIGFRQGKVAMVFEGVYMLSDLQKQQDLDFAGAPVPRIGTVNADWAGSHNLCLRSDLEPRTLQAAWRFVRFLSNNSLDWADGGQIPARRDLRATPRFGAMTVQTAFARQVPYVQYLPRLPFIFEFQTEFDLAVEKALRGSVSPQTALDTATVNIDRIIARERNQGDNP